MPRPQKQPVCFNCGEPATALVNQVKGKANARRICMKRECWEAWYALSTNK